MKIFTLILMLFLTTVCFTQKKLAQQCANNKTYFSNLTLLANGGIQINPCPNANITVNDTSFLIDNLNKPFKLQDPFYVPFAGSLNADVLFSNASNDNIQNNAGYITTSNHFVSFANDIKLVASGANRWHIGFFNQIRVSGAGTGSGNLIGSWDFVNNRGYTGVTPFVVGKKIDINLEGDATESVGIDVASYKGSAVSNPLNIGGRFTAANGYTNAAEVFGIHSIVRTVSTGAEITTGNGLYSQFNISAGHTVENANGLFIGNWINTGTIETSKAVHITNSHNVGTITNFAVASDSTAESYFTGNLRANSGFYLLDSVSGTVKQVVVGANDSCGAGFKCLRVAN
jgi:hypothetical protein